MVKDTDFKGLKSLLDASEVVYAGENVGLALSVGGKQQVYMMSTRMVNMWRRNALVICYNRTQDAYIPVGFNVDSIIGRTFTSGLAQVRENGDHVAGARYDREFMRLILEKVGAYDTEGSLYIPEVGEVVSYSFNGAVINVNLAMNTATLTVGDTLYLEYTFLGNKNDSPAEADAVVPSGALCIRGQYIKCREAPGMGGDLIDLNDVNGPLHGLAWGSLQSVVQRYTAVRKDHQSDVAGHWGNGHPMWMTDSTPDHP